MRDILQFIESQNKDHFKVNYPYYGLFATADVTALTSSTETIYKCILLNGETVLLKKLNVLKKWIDIGINEESPLAGVIGNSIDDFLKSN